MNVLFLSVAIGGGHNKAAEAIREVVMQRYPGSNCAIIDTLKYVNPVIDKIIVGSYLSTVKKTPAIYGKLYELSESADNLNDFSMTVNKLLSYRIHSLINEFNPDIVVCTHPFALQMMSNLKSKKKVTVPVIAVLTDFVLHPLWLRDCIDAYIVAHEFMRHQMIEKGFSPDIVHSFGIPVSRNFLERTDRKQVLRELGLDDKLTILIMGGSLGFGGVRKVFRSLLNSKSDLQIIALSGSNEKLREKLEQYARESHNKKVRVVGYTDRVSYYMDASDFIVTKTGGMTVAESLVKKLPILIISPIPGQEEGNANFLLNNGAAVRITSSDSIDSVLYQLLHNPLRLKQMKEMAEFLAKPNAAFDILNLMEKLITKSKQECS